MSSIMTLIGKYGSLYHVVHLQTSKIKHFNTGIVKLLPSLSKLQLICTSCAHQSTKGEFASIEPIAVKENCPGDVTNEDLEEMFQNKLYNTETWRKVIEYQRKKQKKLHMSRQLPSNQYDDTSIIARTILENVGEWQGDVKNIGDGSEKGALIKRVSTSSNYFPFSVLNSTDFTERTLPLSHSDELEISEPPPPTLVTESSTLIEDVVKEDNLAEIVNSQLSPMHPDYVEIVTLPEPHQPSELKSRIMRETANRWKAFYGTADPSISPSNFSCGGCGAVLHCQDSGIPGYLPSEYFGKMTAIEFQNAICQRCSFLKEYNVALKVSVSPNDFGSIISRLQLGKVLIILMVDLTDFPCSIWPDLISVVGDKQPIVVVGNKVDLLPKEGDDYLERVKSSLVNALKDKGIDTGHNIKDVQLISAFTGYGVEDLITSIQQNWGISGDIYLIGCTNVGKSSLFNALLQSDLCKVQAMDLISRATISQLPGTTLNLLKFPLMRPTPWRTYLRKQRLETFTHKVNQQKLLRRKQLRDTQNPTFATLIGHIGTTFKFDFEKYKIAFAKDPFKLSSGLDGDLPLSRKKFFKSDDPAFAKGKWFYDTPGFINDDQILNLLTLDELSHTIPKRMIVPRCCILKPEHTFFLAGLGRIDYVEGKSSVAFMVFSSPSLPISVVPSRFANNFYGKYLGTSVLKVPFGGHERLKSFPSLLHKEFNFSNENFRECSGDIILSSAGWISVALMENSTARFFAYTPDGKGCYSREPSLLKHSIKLRGKRIAFTPFCNESKLFCY